ncbi:FIG00649665: hypothetical protein [hydrothermal vent metagenome]|uniref:DUF5683 domain-containing protein n=1 Tax=hydrothermal vent metagenome TaxID=652676 RepID=A0A3B0TZQ1_9ZZZZ
MLKTMGRMSIVLFLLLVITVPVNARETVKDTISTQKKVHSPHKATIYSLILPGLGQAYNKKYWKIPLIYIGFGTIGYSINWNNGYYQIFQKAYKDLTDNDAGTTSYEDLFNPGDLSNPTRYSQVKDQLSRGADYYRRNRDLLIISAFGFYALNIIDASVDAHLFDFDISDDLTFNWQPSIIQFDSQKVFCINCTINF